MTRMHTIGRMAIVRDGAARVSAQRSCVCSNVRANCATSCRTHSRCTRWISTRARVRRVRDAYDDAELPTTPCAWISMGRRSRRRAAASRPRAQLLLSTNRDEARSARLPSSAARVRSRDHDATSSRTCSTTPTCSKRSRKSHRGPNARIASSSSNRRARARSHTHGRACPALVEHLAVRTPVEESIASSPARSSSMIAAAVSTPLAIRYEGEGSTCPTAPSQLLRMFDAIGNARTGAEMRD